MQPIKQKGDNYYFHFNYIYSYRDDIFEAFLFGGDSIQQGIPEIVFILSHSKTELEIIQDLTYKKMINHLYPGFGVFLFKN